MSTIEQVRAAEKKIETILDALRTAAAKDLARLCSALGEATSDYAAAVRELEMPNRWSQNPTVSQAPREAR